MTSARSHSTRGRTGDLIATLLLIGLSVGTAVVLFIVWLIALSLVR